MKISIVYLQLMNQTNNNLKFEKSKTYNLTCKKDLTKHSVVFGKTKDGMKNLK